MNFVGKFDFSHFGADAGPGTAVDVRSHDGLADGAHHTIVVPDAHLLFSGDFKRTGSDLSLSKDGHDYVIHDYFKGHARATLASPDGAQLSGDLVNALTGEIQVAQAAGGVAAAKVIGQVTKLTGSATAIRNGVSIQLNMGDNVNKGDVVQAGADSSLGLTFIDGTVFGLSANARMVLNEMVYDPNGSSNSSLLSLVQGTITFVAGETAKHGDMRVDTPVATMGIRGTAVLVEIDFAVPGQGGAPPVKFQVLVEPGGRTGSYVLYSKSDPNVVIGTVNQAGQITSVTGTGDTSTTTAAPLTPIAQAIIQQTLQQYFPSYVPSANPQSTSPGGGGSTPPVPPNNNLEKLPTPGPGEPVLIPITFPGNSNTPPIVINVTVTPQNPAPVLTQASLAVSEGGTVILGAANFLVTDPGSSNFTFIVSDVTHGAFQTTTDGITWVNVSSFTTAQLNAGHVRFIHDGSEIAPSFTITVDDGVGANHLGNSLHGNVGFTNVNNAPLVTTASFAVIEGGTVILSAANFLVVDPDSTSFTFSVSNVTHGAFQTTTDGVHWITVTSFTSAELNAGHVRFVHDGGEAAPTFSITVDDGAGVNHLGNTINGSVAFTNVNTAPVITAASFAVLEGGTVVLSALNFVVVDPDSTSFVFNVSNVSHGAFQTTTDGVHWTNVASFTSAELNAGHVRFVHDGSEVAPAFSVTVDDGSGVNHLGNTINGAIAFTSVNNAPVLTLASFAIAEGGTVLLSAANFVVVDPDSTSFTFNASNVTHGSFQLTTDGIHWGNVTSFTTAELNAGHVRFVHDGGEIAPTFSLTVDDGAGVNHLGNTIAGAIQYTNVNEAPTVTAPLTASASEGATAFTANLLDGATDRDIGETATLSVTHVTYTVDGNAASSTAPAGVSVTGNVLHVDPTNEAFNHLAVGESTTIVVSYNVTDIHGASVAQTETVTVNGTNDTPIAAAGSILDGTITVALSETTGSGSGPTPVGAAVLAAGPGLISGLGGEAGFGVVALPPGDDNSSGAIDITSVFGPDGINFFGHNYTSLYINNNGNITFNGPLSAFTPSAINAGLNNPIIAAFWADVDTRGAGHVYYDIDAVDGVMTITWDHVGYYNGQTNLLNTFQIVLVNEGGGNFDITYRYGDIEWTTGEASGGAAARAGYSAGNGINYFELPESGNASALLHLPTTPGNTGVAGVNGFEVHEGSISPASVTTNGVINFSDVDDSDTHTASVTSTSETVGTLTLKLVHDSTGSGTGGQYEWTYNASTTDVQNAVRHSESGTSIQTFQVSIDDGHGGVLHQTVNVTLNAQSTGEPYIPVLSAGATTDDRTLSSFMYAFKFNAQLGHDAVAADAPLAQLAPADLFASAPLFHANAAMPEHPTQAGIDTLLNVPGHDLVHNASADNFAFGDFIVHGGGFHAAA